MAALANLGKDINKKAAHRNEQPNLTKQTELVVRAKAKPLPTNN